MDLKTIAEGFSLIGKGKELYDKVTHKDEIGLLEAEVASRDKQLKSCKCRARSLRPVLGTTSDDSDYACCSRGHRDDRNGGNQVRTGGKCSVTTCRQTCVLQRVRTTLVRLSTQRHKQKAPAVAGAL